AVDDHRQGRLVEQGDLLVGLAEGEQRVAGRGAGDDAVAAAPLVGDEQRLPAVVVGDGVHRERAVAPGDGGADGLLPAVDRHVARGAVSSIGWKIGPAALISGGGLGLLRRTTLASQSMLRPPPSLCASTNRARLPIEGVLKPQGWASGVTSCGGTPSAGVPAI